MTDESADDIEAHDHAIVDKAVADLLMHFDSVQVFVTRQESQNTLACSKGMGNWYARYGQVVEWLDNGGAMHLRESEEE